MAATKEINGRTYSFGEFACTDALRIEVSIARVIGEPLFKAFMDIKPSKTAPKVLNSNTDAFVSPEDQETNQQAAAMSAIGMLTAKMDADELIALFKLILTVVTCDGKRCQIDSTFTGRNKDIWLVIIEALKVNFSDFFPERLLVSLKGKIPSL